MRKIIKTVLILLIIINFLYCVSGAINYPLVSVDVYVIWLFKAKEFFINGVLPLNRLNPYFYSHPQYPILLPLVFSFIYKISGGVNELTVLIIYPFVYLAILYLAYRLFLKLGISSLNSLILTYVYSMLSPLLAAGGRLHAGEADIFLVLIYWGIMHLTFNFYKNGQKIEAFFIVLLIMIASQIKMEGVFPAVLFLFMPLINRKKIIYTAISALPFVLWQITRKYMGVEANFGFEYPGFNNTIYRAILILLMTAKEMLNWRNWYIFWPLFFLVLSLKTKDIKFLEKFVKPFLISQVLLFYIGNILNNQDTYTFMISTADRIMLQLSPFYMTFFAVKLNYLINLYAASNKLKPVTAK